MQQFQGVYHKREISCFIFNVKAIVYVVAEPGHVIHNVCDSVHNLATGLPFTIGGCLNLVELI